MSTFLKNLFENEKPIVFHKIALSLLGIILLRSFLENFSSPLNSGYFFPPKEIYIFFPIYYISVFLSFALLLYFFTKRSLTRILNFEIKIFLFVLIPPILDLLITSGKGDHMNFIMATPNNFIYIFLKLLNPLGFGGITTGIHAAAYLIITGLFLFIYRSTKKITQSIIGSIIAYIILFIYAISPSFLAISQLLKTGQTSAANAYQQTIENSWLWMQQATITPISISENINALEYFSDIPMAQLFFLTMSFQLFLLFIIYYPKLWLSMKTNLRPLRVIFWFFISGTGIFIAKNIYADLSFSNSINLLSMIVFMFLIALNIWLAVCINDAEDTEIDLLSNFNRPLIKNEFTISQWNKLTLFLLFLVIIGVSTMNTNVSFLFIVAQLSYYMYSSFPLRLKSNFVSSSLLIGIAAATISMAGFFLVSPDQHTLAFPASAILLIGLVVALISNFKDIKDFTGDSSAKIQTMPVFFGLEKSKKIIATFFTFIIIFLPYILKIKNMLFLSIILSVFILYLFTKKNYQEKYIFLLMFIYFFSLFIFYK